MYGRQGDMNSPAGRPPNFLNRPPPFLRDLPRDMNGQAFYPDSNYSNRNNNIEIITQDLRLGSERRSERSRFERDHERDFRRVEGMRDFHPTGSAEYYGYTDVRPDINAYGHYGRYESDNIAATSSYSYDAPLPRMPLRIYDRRASYSPSSRSSSRSRSSFSSVSRASSYGSSSKDGSYRARGSRKRKSSRTKEKSSRSSSTRHSGHRRRSHRRSKDRSRDRSRERSRDRVRSRDRSRSRSRDRSRDRARSKGGHRERHHSRHRHSVSHSSSVASSWKDETPNKTIMLRGLGLSVVENDIFNDISGCALEARDVRIIRNRETGASRGIAFVEFKDVTDATKWMEAKQGLVIVGEDRIRMHYNVPKDGNDRGNGSSSVIKLDWNCIKCSARNFRRRDFCYKCDASRADADQSKYLDGYEEIGIAPRGTLLFRNLDVLTTEEKILTALQSITALPIKHIRVMKDPLNGISRGYCFVELNSTGEAVALHDKLHAKDVPLYVDGRIVSVTYARQSISSLGSATTATVASTAMAAAQWTNQMPTAVPAYEARTATTTTNATRGHPMPPPTVTTTAQAVSYVPQRSYGDHSRSSAGISKATAKVASSASAVPTDTVTITSAPVINLKAVGVTGPDGQYPKFSTPDVSTYQYDKATGYYYDPVTGLHYDANSQYYYNSQTQQFLYWDGDKHSYLPAAGGDASAAGEEGSDAVGDNESSGAANGSGFKKPKEKDRQDKVKIAKKIAKDMEKWAKTLNQKKENAKQGIVANQAYAVDSLGRQSATADAGFAVLEKKATLAERQAAVIEALKKKDMGSITGLVASYGGDGSDTDEDGGDGGNPLDESRLLDWQKLACLLCKRQFPTKEALVRHQQLSDLHKQNMEALKKSTESKYRDRAKERRVKYGEPENPPPEKIKDMFAASNTKVTYEQPTKRGIDASNVGNKMLKAMGWSEGQGLGKSNQGRTELVEASKRVAVAGLGMKGSNYGANAEDTYTETVKKMMQARYKDSDMS